MSEGDGKFEDEITQSGDLIIDGFTVDRDPARADAAAASLPTAQPAPTHVRLDDEDVPLDEIRRMRRRFPELESTVQEIAPFKEVLQSPQFQTWLEDAVQAGVFNIPAPDAPDPADVVGYRQRAQDPEYHAILAEINEWAKALPVQDRHMLDNSHKWFNAVFDHFKLLHEGAQVGRAIAEAELRKRERAHDQTITVRGGGGTVGGSETYGPGNSPIGRDRRIETLKVQSRRGNRDAEVLLAKALLDGDDK